MRGNYLSCYTREFGPTLNDTKDVAFSTLPAPDVPPPQKVRTNITPRILMEELRFQIVGRVYLDQGTLFRVPPKTSEFKNNLDR